MKNSTPAQRAALKKRAASIARRLPGSTFEAEAARILRRYRAVGASLVLISPQGEQFFPFGQARLSPPIPVTGDTCFRVASVSKLVMTFGTLSLVQDGLLDLDCDISACLGYPVRHPRAPDVPVTLRMLLTHTSSIRDEGTYGTRGMETGCTLRELLDDPQNWLPQPPGTSFHYSNLGAGAAGVTMECASGMPFDEIMQTRVFAPLRIRASYDPRKIAPTDDLADGYGVRGIVPPRLKYDAARLAARPPDPFCPERDYLIAPGRLITDSRGMAQLLRLLASRDGMGVLPGRLLDMMRTPQDGAAGIGFAGRGLNTAFLPDVFEGFSPVGHQGVAYGMCAELFADPASGCGVGVMTNGVRFVRARPLMRAGFDLLALGFAELARQLHD